MTIGELERASGVTAMTIRFYIKEGLLTPAKKGTQWDFSQAELEALLRVKTLRGYGFSIKTLQTLLALKETPEDKAKERAVIQGELMRLTEERKGLSSAIVQLEKTIAATRLLPDDEDAVPDSISFSLFKLIACPYCGSTLAWEQVVIRENAVTAGLGKCGCGFSATIDAGILMADNHKKPLIPIVDTERQTLRKRRPQDVSCVEKYYMWLHDRLMEQELSGSIIFEDVINTICFCSRAVTELPGRPSFILCDTDPGVARYYANSMRLQKPDCKLLVIVDDGVHHPLKRGCIDIVLDYCSSEILQSHGYPSACSIISPYVKPRAFILGRFTRMTKRRQPLALTKPGYTRSDAMRYDLNILLEDMEQHNVALLSEIRGPERLDESIYDGCAPGDEMQPYVFTGRWR